MLKLTSYDSVFNVADFESFFATSISPRVKKMENYSSPMPVTIQSTWPLLIIETDESFQNQFRSNYDSINKVLQASKKKFQYDFSNYPYWSSSGIIFRV